MCQVSCFYLKVHKKVLAPLLLVSLLRKSNVRQATGDTRQDSQNMKVCRVCGKLRGARMHPDFKQMDLQSRWDCAKQCIKLCFCCLGNGHLGQYCNQTRVCGIDNCKELHHRLLHKYRSGHFTTQN